MIFLVSKLLAPNHQRARDSMEWYEEQLEKEGLSKREMRKNLPQLINRRPGGNKERDIYEALCRGEVPVVGKAGVLALSKG